jgi:hypothetical protein
MILQDLAGFYRTLSDLAQIMPTLLPDNLDQLVVLVTTN